MYVTHYRTHGTGHDGKPYNLLQPFVEAQARQVGSALAPEGLPLVAAVRLVNMWNAQAARQGNTCSYAVELT